MPKRALAAIAGFLSTFVIIGIMGMLGGASAQDSGATPAAGGAVEGHPAHIHSGTCDNLGEVVYPLNNIVTLDAASPGAEAVASPSLVVVSTPVIAAGQASTVDAALEDILAADHAINVHQSPENIDVYIACGNITGTVTDGVLIVDLEELNASGFMGQAALMDNGDGTTTVYMDLIPSNVATPAT